MAIDARRRDTLQKRRIYAEHANPHRAVGQRCEPSHSLELSIDALFGYE